MECISMLKSWQADSFDKKTENFLTTLKNKQAQKFKESKSLIKKF